MKKTTSDDPDFQTLAAELEQYLRIRDGDLQDYFAQLNTIGWIGQVLVAYQEGQPIACGAIRPHDPVTMEIKRMYVRPIARGQGLASAILSELENWARESGCSSCILETGTNQPEAIALYEKCNYRPIPRYGKYKDSEFSVCFRKDLGKLA